MDSTEHNSKLNYAVGDNFLLRRVVAMGNTQLLRNILRKPGVNPEAKSNEALRYACRYGLAEIAKVLLETHQVRAWHPNHYPLYMACKGRYEEIVMELLKYYGQHYL